MTEDQSARPRITQAEQEERLKDHPEVRRFAESRRALAGDPWRPLYHFVSPESGLNDPNGLCFWQGHWHLFYQGYPPENPRPHWGHAIMVELNVLRSPSREEFTRIAFYRHRGYVDWDRSDGWTRFSESRDSLITLDTSYSSELPDVSSRAPETAAVWLAPEETLKLRVFIDRSVVEVFVNGRQCAAARVYPGRPDSLGISLRAQGADAELHLFDAWQMQSIYGDL